ncbi:MAG: hypothetical protein Q7U84_01930 [Polynucleobacter sp.]|nr:hypothetical protein [Polynucleobacter sp.]
MNAYRWTGCIVALLGGIIYLDAWIPRSVKIELPVVPELIAGASMIAIGLLLIVVSRNRSK